MRIGPVSISRTDFWPPSDRALVGIALSGVVLGLYGGFIGWYGPALTSAIASSGLVLATTLSLVTTRETLREQRLSREQEAKPLLRIHPEPTTLSAYCLMVQNVGNGPAKSVSVTIEGVDPDGEANDSSDQIQATLPTISPGESVALSAGMEEVENPRSSLGSESNDASSEGGNEASLSPADHVTEDQLQNYHSLKMSGSCKDILDNTHAINSEYKIRYLEEGMALHAGTDTPTELKNIRKAIERLDRERNRR